MSGTFSEAIIRMVVEIEIRKKFDIFMKQLDHYRQRIIELENKIEKIEKLINL